MERIRRRKVILLICSTAIAIPPKSQFRCDILVDVFFCSLLLYILLFTEVIARHYYVCCRDGNFRMNLTKRTTGKKRVNQKSSRKINDVCLSRMYVNEYQDHVEVQYVSAHTNHKLCTSELPHLPMPRSSMDEVAFKVSRGIASERILEGELI